MSGLVETHVDPKSSLTLESFFGDSPIVSIFNIYITIKIYNNVLILL